MAAHQLPAAHGRGHNDLHLGAAQQVYHQQSFAFLGAIGKKYNCLTHLYRLPSKKAHRRAGAPLPRGARSVLFFGGLFRLFFQQAAQHAVILADDPAHPADDGAGRTNVAHDAGIALLVDQLFRDVIPAMQNTGRTLRWDDLLPWLVPPLSFRLGLARAGHFNTLLYCSANAAKNQREIYSIFSSVVSCMGMPAASASAGPSTR